MIEKLSEELASLYKVHIPEYLANLKQAIDKEDLVTMRDVAHNLSSAMGSIGDIESGALFKRIEKDDLALAVVSALLVEAESLVADTLTQI
jgi:HPt (histidine-containing phosphotransfer) domain-containing protein